ncbi:MAG: choice-of-anchor Q domain-containing protein [Pseudomonadota bacterium]
MLAFSDVVSNTAEFSASIAKFNAETSGEHTITLSQSIVLTAKLPDINNSSAVPTLVIDGNANEIDGDGQFSLFNVRGNSDVTLTDIAVKDSLDSVSITISVFESASLTIDRAVFEDNGTANGSPGVLDIGNSATVIVRQSAFLNNSADAFGGAIENTGSLTVSDSLFDGNTAGSFGGAIYTGSTAGASTTVLRSSFDGNSADSGGGAIASFGDLTVRGSTFFNNDSMDIGPSSDVGGGGILGRGSNTRIYHSTFSSNTSNSGRGDNILFSGLTVTSSFEMVSSISTDGDCVALAGPTAQSINNLVEPTTTTTSFQCRLGAANNAFNANALLGNYGNRTGSLPVMPPLAGSPAIDGAVLNGVDVVDQRGRSLLNDTPDIGAVEHIKPDSFEDNDVFTNPSMLQDAGRFENLSIDDTQSNDEDWYAIELDQGEEMTVDVFFIDAIGDLDISIHTDDAVPIQLASAISIDDDEQIVFTAPEDGTFLINVDGFSDARNDYDMSISIPSRDQICFPVDSAVICI